MVNDKAVEQYIKHIEDRGIEFGDIVGIIEYAIKRENCLKMWYDSIRLTSIFVGFVIGLVCGCLLT